MSAIQHPVITNWCRLMGATVPDKGDYAAIRRIAIRKDNTADRAQYDSIYTTKISNIFQIVGKQVAGTYRVSPHLDDTLSILEDRVIAPLQETISTLLVVVEKAFGRGALNTIRGKAAGDEDVWDPASSPELTAWNKKQLAQHVTAISKATKRSISQIVLSGIDDGLTTDEIADAIAESFSFSASRAETIAQTEVTAASNAGRRFAIKANVSNFSKLTKVWSAVGDRRTRASHSTASGQEQKFNVAYKVGGASLMFPGDTSLGAPAREVVRCRCTEVYSR